MVDTPPPLGRKSRNAVVAEAATALCRGASIYLAITPGHSGQLGDNLAAVKDAGAWHAQLEPYLKDSAMIGNVAVVLGSPSVDGSGLPAKNNLWSAFKNEQIDPVFEAISICEDLESAGMFPQVLYAYADYTNWPADLSHYKAIVLPERALLDDAHAQALKDYVKQGGQLIAFGYAGYLNARGDQRLESILLDVLAFREDRILVWGGQLTFTDALKETHFQNLTFSTTEGTMSVVPGPDAKVLATIDGKSGQPALIRHGYDQGASFYVSSGEAAFRGNRAFWTGMRSMVVGEPSFVLKNSEVYHREGSVYAYRNEVNKDLNRYTTILKQTEHGKMLHLIDKEVLKSTVTILLDPSTIGAFTKATVIETGDIVGIEHRSGKLQLTVTCNPVASILFK